MVETDWREILSLSQRELMQADKDKLCESLSWMEADDIELNFSDLKTLFRLAQDILKYKTEEVNNLLGQIETLQKKGSKGKVQSTSTESPTRSDDSPLETIAHQEEVIKANKEILEQLYADIAELEGRKTKFNEAKNDAEGNSESSKDPLSEMNAIVQLENSLAMKNKHLRKLLNDIKVLENENTMLKDKATVLKDKLTEASQLIDNLTEQVVHINKENIQLKELLGKSNEAKSQLAVDIEYLRKEMFEKESARENIYEEIKSKVLHWKNIARSKKADIKTLCNENARLTEDLLHASKMISSPKKKELRLEELKLKELQDKLSEASEQIELSANLIDSLKAENRQLKLVLEETPDYTVSDAKNESDDGKERTMINKLKGKVKKLTVALQGAEEMVAERENELTEITSQLQLVQSDDGISALLQGLKNKKKQLKLKDEGIKSLVVEVNTLSQTVNDLQLQNEIMRVKLNVPLNEDIPTTGILKKYRDLEQNNIELTREAKKLENSLIMVELENRNLKLEKNRMCETLRKLGNKDNIDIVQGDDNSDLVLFDGGGEGSAFTAMNQGVNSHTTETQNIEGGVPVSEMKEIIEENEGLRKGLQEILDFLKDNSTTSSGVLALQCPSLDSILQAMEARHSAGWFAPHMTTVMQLREALGSKDALISALHDARKETFDTMDQLSKETQRSSELQQKLHDIETKVKYKETEDKTSNGSKINFCEFGSWISEKEQNCIDFYDKEQIDNAVMKGNMLYEGQLKKSLEYFHNKFKVLYDKMTTMVIQAADDRNKWDIQEEQYKAHIENLKSQVVQIEDDDISDISPGIVAIPSMSFLQRKCTYLEESYKYIRTLNENMKNENLENKKDAMQTASDYEVQIQKLILAVANLTDKLRCSISLDLFWKQNFALNEFISKYRKLIEAGINNNCNNVDFLNLLERNKLEIIDYIERQHIGDTSKTEQSNTRNILTNIEQTVFQKQLNTVCSELEDKNKIIEGLQQINMKLQESQGIKIEETLGSVVKEDVEIMKDQLQILADDNKTLKEQCQHVNNQLDIALMQLQDHQQRQMSNDMEINILRHQILDLQSTGDNKAIIARLGSEVLVAHLQASENHQKIERLNSALLREKDYRMEAEEMLKTREKIFEVYSYRYESKFRYMYEIMQVLRQQYQGSLPIASIENYLNKMEEINRLNQVVHEKLYEIEDMQSNLMTKHSVFDQILDVSKNKCLVAEDSCTHKLKYIMMQAMHTREMEHINRKLKALEQSQEESIKHCNNLEKTLVLVNQGFEKSSHNGIIDTRTYDQPAKNGNLELEDVQSDDELGSRKSQTITLPKPQVLKHPVDSENFYDKSKHTIKTNAPSLQVTKTASVQTTAQNILKDNKFIQTDFNTELSDLKKLVNDLREENFIKNEELADAKTLAQQRTEDSKALHTERNNLENVIVNLRESSKHKDQIIERHQITIDELRRQLDEIKSIQFSDRSRINETLNEENKSLLVALKQLESDKNDLVAEYKKMLESERNEYSKSVKDMHVKIMELQTKLDGKTSESNATNSGTLKDIVSKYTMKISQLEDKCFKLESELDECKTELTAYQSETDRWKALAAERLSKMEQLSSQLETRHCHEVDSYKAENQHWLSQLSETQKEHTELRMRLNEQKALYLKQIADKDAQIEQLRSVVHNLKTQIMNMQTMISVNDPSFDLSAIVEVDEVSDSLSQQGSERLELKYDSTVDVQDMHDDIIRAAHSSSSIWQEPVIERLRREKQLTGKQNMMLRRQIKALAARERRSRLDAQNLKNQIFRISTSNGKVTTAETATLHHKIATLQSQLTTAHRDTNSSVALWDKWKRAQQASERWQARFSEKCQEVVKLESSINLAKAALTRLEKEKRVLLSRLTEVKHQNQLAIEKQDNESLEKSPFSNSECICMKSPTMPVSSRALLERVQAQQRRIVALEVAEKGNEFLVSEYEKSLAEITSLKGQVLKLESTLLESQIKTPMKTVNDTHTQPELEYWKSYCDMLKEENVQLTLRVNSLEPSPSTSHNHRINDLEQTVLTLRGLVSKLQAEQKSATSHNVHKRVDSRPSSGRSTSDKGRNQQESHRVEIANLKRNIQEKDLLLERSKEMLKIAAEREDELLRENAYLRQRLDELVKPKGGGFPGLPKLIHPNPQKS